MRRERRPYLTLWASVLEKAIEDLYYEPPETPEDLSTYENRAVDQELYWKRQAQQWFKSKGKQFNSFEGICVILGLEPSRIRTRLYEKGLLFE
jgi:hypothetical protein